MVDKTPAPEPREPEAREAEKFWNEWVNTPEGGVSLFLSTAPSKVIFAFALAYSAELRAQRDALAIAHSLAGQENLKALVGLHERAEAAESSLLQAREAKDGAYSERDNLVAALSKLFPSSLERHPDSDTAWDDDWRWIVFIDLPTGQATWHISDSELPMFTHLPRFTGRTWDGHTTPQKYLRLAALSTSAKEGT